MASNILSIGQSALYAAQTALATTSHNLSNVNTAGYNRQIVVQSSAGALATGAGFVGQGTQITDISRVYDSFLNQQVMTSQTSTSKYTAYAAQISGINNTIADTSAGLSPALQSFFSDLQSLTATPNTDASRQEVLSGAQTLTARFQALASQLSDSKDSVNQQISGSVDSINSMATQVSALNKAIQAAQTATGDTPNDLLDQRDQVIASMNKIVKVTTQPTDNGGIDVFVGNGQGLVVGDTVQQLVAQPSLDDSSQTEVALKTANGTVISLPDSGFTGGSLAGIMQYRSETLGPTQNALGRIATVMASDFNAQNKLGLDQNGVAGGDFFSIDPPAVIGRSTNSATAAASVTITTPSALTTSDYRLQYDGTKYTVTRLSDNTKTTIASSPYPTPAPEIDGITFAQPTMAAGDSFTIKPTANAASSFSVALTGTSAIAAAAPILAAAATTNTGTGAISAGTVDKSYLASPPTLPLTLTFGTGGTSFTMTDGSTPPAAVLPDAINGVAYTGGTPVAYTSGSTYTYKGASFTITGAPAVTTTTSTAVPPVTTTNADTFTVAANTNAASDSRNIQLLGALQTSKTIGNTTYQGAYSTVVSQIGNKTSEINVLNTAEQSRLATITAAQESESGVNSDEELANMIKYQTAYQAGAKIIQAASDMLNVLFTLGN